MVMITNLMLLCGYCDYGPALYNVQLLMTFVHRSISRWQIIKEIYGCKRMEQSYL